MSGADGYILKANAEDVLHEALNVIHQNEIFIDKRLGLEQQMKGIFIKRKEILEYINIFELTKRGRTFIMLNATTLSYEQITATMSV